MKFGLLFLVFILSNSFAAIDCKDPSVILSLKKPKCENLIELPLSDSSNFDIPELDLNYKDLDLILKKESEALGADSSGGGISPQAGRATVSNRPQEVFNCELKIITDGNKKYRFLSEASFKLKAYEKVHQFNFTHSLQESLSPENIYAISQIPNNLDLERISIERNDTEIHMCRKNIGHKFSNKTCAKGDLEAGAIKIKLIQTKTLDTFSTTQELFLKCSLPRA